MLGATAQISEPKKEEADLNARLFQKQIALSESAGFEYQKSVAEVNEASASGSSETRSISVNAASTDWRKDLEPALEYLYANPKIIEYFSVERTADRVSAERLPKVTETPLKKQKFEWDKNGVLRSVEAEIAKENWLYVSKTFIKVDFSADGKYSAHSFLNEIEGLGLSTAVRITGAARYKSL